ncbi:hypothetical protein [Cupriavidus oxalaticus]|uniref:hypothetical protein n=1 Tax=Cupriavidus oxalaticus TaxID=96344 RepID=UPI0012446352|nr:hypothetical protein [Cupriavidus oxalaticus]
MLRTREALQLVVDSAGLMAFSEYERKMRGHDYSMLAVTAHMTLSPVPRGGCRQRRAAIDTVAESGRRKWAKAGGYHRRSLVEKLYTRDRQFFSAEHSHDASPLI